MTSNTATAPTARSVPFFNYPHVFTSQEEDLVRIFREVGNRGAFILQKDLADFERDLATYAGCKHALGVANATDGLQIALMAGGIGPGDEVIFCSHTMVATAAAIHFAGALPVPVDVGPDHLIDVAAIDSAITPRTKAVMPTQLNGRTADMDAIRAICAKRGILLFEDAAQALGSRWNGTCAGTFGVASAISFYPAKILGCLGDGGAVLTNDDRVHERLLLLRDHGRNHDGDVVEWGFNTRLDNLQAAFLSHGLKSHDAVIARRRGIASLYQQRLGGLDRVALPPAPDADRRHFDIYQNYEIEADSRDDLKPHLKDRGIGTLIQWGGKAVHQFPKLGLVRHLPKTERMFQRCLMLPMNMSMTDEDVHYVCDHIHAFYRR